MVTTSGLSRWPRSMTIGPAIGKKKFERVHLDEIRFVCVCTTQKLLVQMRWNSAFVSVKLLNLYFVMCKHLNCTGWVKFSCCFNIIVVILTVAWIKWFHSKFDLCLLNTLQMLNVLINKNVTRFILVNWFAANKNIERFYECIFFCSFLIHPLSAVTRKNFSLHLFQIILI